MTFREFIDYCVSYLDNQEEKFFFVHKYAKGGYEFYKIGIIGNASCSITYGVGITYGVVQYCYPGDFENCNSLDEALDKIKEVLL